MRRDAPATARNRAALLVVLRTRFVRGSRVLELAAGTGQHAAFFSSALDVQWVPTDPDPQAVASIDSWRSDGGEGLQPAVCMGVEAPAWGGPYDGIFCCNMIHITPWECTEALFTGAGRELEPGGTLITYGPYRIDGEHTSESNVRFEGWLHSLDSRYGVRDIGRLEVFARSVGLRLEERIPMPANNFSLVWVKET